MVKNIGVDKILIVIIALLVLIGIIMIYSTTMLLAQEKYGDSFYYLKRQLLWLLIGTVIFIIVTFFKFPFYLNSKMIGLFLIVSTLLLILVFFTGKVNDSYRWLRFWGLSIQPSEFAKIAVVLYLAFILGKISMDEFPWKKLLVQLVPVFIIALLILKEPDLGTFFLIIGITLMLLFIAGLKLRFFLITFACLIPLVYTVLKLNPDKMNRILAFFNPEAYSATYNFQTVQSVYAIGSGGIFGQGLGSSTQKLYFLPYAYSDFIYPIIAEEIGLLGSILVLALFVGFIIRSLAIAKFSGNRQTYLLVSGLGFLIALQAFLNISVAIGLVPAKGIPLPFISNGGSSLIGSLIIAAIVLNVSKHRRMVFLGD